MIIAVDFDGTVVEHKFPEIGTILPGVKETMFKIIQMFPDTTFILWTCRTGIHLAEAEMFCKGRNLPFMYYNENAHHLSFKPVPKIYADIYIDDHNLGQAGFPLSWSNVFHEVDLWRVHNEPMKMITEDK